MASKEILYKQKKFKISYQILNIDKMKTIVFLHGWGSNKEIMSQAFGKNFDNRDTVLSYAILSHIVTELSLTLTSQPPLFQLML